MTGFLCSTPYHILICLSMALTDYANDDKTLIIMNRFKDAKRISALLKQSGVFKYVKFMDTHDFDRFKNWNRRLRMFMFYPELKAHFSEESFDNFIFFAPDLLEVSYVIKLVYNKNNYCNFFFAEDGIGAYVDESIYKPNRGVKRWLQILHRIDYLNLIKGIYLIHPELCTASYSYNKIKIENINTSDPVFVKLIHLIWGNEYVNNCQTLLLHQPFVVDGKPEVGSWQDKCFELINQNFAGCCVKLHPREKDSASLRKFRLFEAKGVFEVLLMNGFSPKCLVGVNSTALLTPFMLWNLKPTLIFLYKICHYDGISKRMDLFLENFKVIYSKNGGELYIPGSFDELEGLLKFKDRHLNESAK